MKIIKWFVVCFAIFCISCEGDPGPPGRDGLDGLPGPLAQVFEVQIDFTAANNFEFLVSFPSNIEVFDSDVVAAYILDEVDNGVDIWEPLPQTLFLGNDILIYGYDFSSSDINFFIDGTIDPSTLDPIYTDDVIFRVAIIPAEFARSLDLSNFQSIMNELKIQDFQQLR
ncbi:hypothetical protein ACFQ1M_13510 [Sungkyunkwania multivorans]|uniref:Collagen-like protein n=1 Tax=Sungkyunkwania multivorans TaxID=1173618 RepID=A0ABW3CZI7_9FLAO